MQLFCFHTDWAELGRRCGWEYGEQSKGVVMILNEGRDDEQSVRALLEVVAEKREEAMAAGKANFCPLFADGIIFGLLIGKCGNVRYFLLLIL